MMAEDVLSKLPHLESRLDAQLEEYHKGKQRVRRRSSVRDALTVSPHPFVLGGAYSSSIRVAC
jgi:hypothetical protein